MHHLGILAHSIEGSALCYKAFAAHGFDELGAHQHPDVSLDCIAMGRSMAAWDAEDYPIIRTVLELSVSRLARSDAEFFVCPDNTAHIALGTPGPQLTIPGLHIAQVLAATAAGNGYRKVGILGTRYTMQHPMYAEALATEGLGWSTPNDREQSFIHDTIFTELVEGRLHDASRRGYVEVIERLATEGCDAVALACTEIPLLISPSDSPLPVLDSTRLLARAAYEVAVGRAPMPTWRGGPINRIAEQ